MAKPTAIQRAFLAGVRHGRRLAHKRVRLDVEDLIDEVHGEMDATREQAADDEVEHDVTD